MKQHHQQNLCLHHPIQEQHHSLCVLTFVERFLFHERQCYEKLPSTQEDVCSFLTWSKDRKSLSIRVSCRKIRIKVTPFKRVTCDTWVTQSLRRVHQFWLTWQRDQQERSVTTHLSKTICPLCTWLFDPISSHVYLKSKQQSSLKKTICLSVWFWYAILWLLNDK
jgi:hypothetical protein